LAFFSDLSCLISGFSTDLTLPVSVDFFTLGGA
jgi:hypothetical protein